ncbi:MAG: metal ABC transporter ATP-binding protein, partial [bacterium]
GLYREIGWCRPIKRSHRAAAMKALEEVGVADLAGRQISQLSGGQQQRTFLARALVQNADLYLMDEPFAGVDIGTEEMIMNVLKSMKQAGKTIIAIHNDLMSVSQHFDNA